MYPPHPRRRHARERARERLGVEVDDVTFELILLEIKTGQAHMITRKAKRVTVWQTKIAGITCWVYHDSGIDEIVTVIRKGTTPTKRKATANRGNYRSWFEGRHSEAPIPRWVLRERIELKECLKEKLELKA